MHVGLLLSSVIFFCKSSSEIPPKNHDTLMGLCVCVCVSMCVSLCGTRSEYIRMY